MLYADQRWIGEHGIGRFARKVLSSLDYHPIPLESHPASPFEPWRLARALERLGVTSDDVFFSPGYTPPLFCKASFVLTIHDLNHIDRPENSNVAKRMYYATVLKRACHEASRVLTVSEFSRSRIVEWSGVSADKVLNVGCGVDLSEHHSRASVSPFSFPYLLCVSNRKGHKNEFRTVEGFARAEIPEDVKLVFTGNLTAQLSDVIRLHRLESRVHFVGAVSEVDLHSLYQSAQALIFVSLYEGFGLPVLEAMACGTPVITSNITALPEVAGDAAVLVNPTCIDEIADAIRRILGDKALRQQFRTRGFAQAAQFSWASTIDKVRDALNSQAVQAKATR